MGKQPSSKSSSSSSTGSAGGWEQIRTPPKPSLWDHFEADESDESDDPAEEATPDPTAETAETDLEPSAEADEASSAAKKRRYKMRSIEDVIASSERIFNDFQHGRVCLDEVEAFAKVAQLIVNAKKAHAAIGGDKPTPVDLTKIASKPDIETIRPLFVQAKNFAQMSDQERRELFEKTRPGSTNGNGHGNGNGHS
jgi:hypothetical protein